MPIRRARCGRCQAKSADNTGCLIEHFGNADAVPQLPERCLSRKAGIVRYCPKVFGYFFRAVPHLQTPARYAILFLQ
ncbi:MAG: hypothetical protein ACLUZX_10495 [Subdoligranulum sp.]